MAPSVTNNTNVSLAAVPVVDSSLGSDQSSTDLDENVSCAVASVFSEPSATSPELPLTIYRRMFYTAQFYEDVSLLAKLRQSPLYDEEFDLKIQGLIKQQLEKYPSS
jgi:hypothetical protein